MKRDILKYAEAGHKKLMKAQAYSLSLTELRNLIDYEMKQAQKTGCDLTGVYEAVTQAFSAGFEAGSRCEKARHRNDRQ